MTTVKNEYDDRKKDIDKFFKLYSDIAVREAQLVYPNEGDTRENISSDVVAILKSGLFLAYYNCVESTVTNCLNRIVRAIQEDNCKYNELNRKLKKTYMSSYFGRINSDSSSIKERVPIIMDMIDYIVFDTAVSVELKDLLNSSSEGNYSGSLDARLVRKTFEKFGVDLTGDECAEMQKIKDIRNQLAHGEKAFNECCRDFVPEYIEKAKTNLFSFLDQMISKVEDYLDNKKYLVANFADFGEY
ncbi:MAG: MAE_28990/MAE_18760 family HEPN-like nuclease [Bacteroidales bacterium]|nr:MAE_28990/MAE_18760 family HEPN-like nuclease [Bacteroidales bacterium]